MERDEVGRLFTNVGSAMMTLMGMRQQPDRPQLADEVRVGADGVMRNVERLVTPGVTRDQIRSTADVLDVISRLSSDQGGSLFPPVEGECQHRYVYLHTEHGQDIYVCQQDGCDKHLTIPGRIIEPAPIVEEERTEVTEDEQPEGSTVSPARQPGEAEEVASQDPPP